MTPVETSPLRCAIARVFDATWQRCRVHWMRNALAHVTRGQHTVVAAAIRQAFSQPDQDGAVQARRHVADHLRRRWPTQHRYMLVEASAQIDAVSTDPLLSIETEAA